jgi:peptidyl-prolyl cis-trans isomerase C
MRHSACSRRIDILRRAVTIPRRFALLALLVLAATSCASSFRSAAAVVDGRRITDKDLQQEVASALADPQTAQQFQGDEGRAELTRQALVELIQNELIEETAIRRRIVPARAAIDQQLQQIEGQFSTQQEFEQRLKQAGLSLALLRQRIENKLVADKLKADLAPSVSDAEVRAVYARERAQFRQIMAKHILFQVDQTTTDAQALKQANDALAQLRGGADFSALAKKLSDDTGSKPNGGDLGGWVSISSLDQSFAAAAWSAKIRVVTDPVRSQFGYHLILTERKRVQPLTEVSAQLRGQLQQQGGDAALSDFIRKLVKRAHIEVNPRYGDWDPQRGTIRPHEFFQPGPVDTTTQTPLPQPSLPLGIPTP